MSTSVIHFHKHENFLSLGIEIELQVIDGNSLLLTPRAAEIIAAGNPQHLKQEFFQSTLEVVTGICKHIHDAEKDIHDSTSMVKKCGEILGLKFASTGTHPEADYRDRLITPSPRYNDLTDRNQWLIRRMAVYGMHMHLGMASGDQCILYNNFFLHFVPHLIALTASSPFWQGMNTGLAASRPTTYEALPTAGMPYIVKDWKEFQKLISFLQNAHAIQSIRDLWWDLRPSPDLGTIELRMCDVPATRAELLGVTAFIHLLALWFRDHQEEWMKKHLPIRRWIFRENKWKAIRYGLDAEIIVSKNGKTKFLKDDILHWLTLLAPYAQLLSYEKYLSIIPFLLEKGGSAERQRRVFEQTNDVHEVAKHNVSEWEKGVPSWI